MRVVQLKRRRLLDLATESAENTRRENGSFDIHDRAAAAADEVVVRDVAGIVPGGVVDPHLNEGLLLDKGMQRAVDGGEGEVGMVVAHTFENVRGGGMRTVQGASRLEHGLTLLRVSGARRV